MKTQFLFVNEAKICYFKGKHCEIKPYQLFLDSVSNDFTFDNMKTTGFYGNVFDFSTITFFLQ